jgi:hypothetical protein
MSFVYFTTVAVKIVKIGPGMPMCLPSVLPKI